MNSKLPRLAIVILNWNDSKSTIQCAESVIGALKSAHRLIGSSEICIVDNGSKPDDLRRVRDWCGKRANQGLTFKANSSNLGYSGGMNAGIRDATQPNPDFYWLLNNDTIVDQDSISALLNYSATNRNHAIVGATIMDFYTGKLQSAGGYRYYPCIAYSKPILAGATLETASTDDSVAPDYVDGAAMWLRGELLQRTGGVPSNHFLYFEELELNQQLAPQETTGWCREAVITHLGGGSVQSPDLQDFATYHAALSAFRYTRLYYPWFLPSVIIARLVGISIRAIQRRQPSVILALLRALRDSFRPGKDQ